MPRSSRLVLTLLAFAATASSAHASSIAVTPPAAPQHYWSDIHFTVSGSADQDAHITVAYTATANATCPASSNDTGRIAGSEAIATDVPAGAFSQDVYLATPAVPPGGAYSMAWNGRRPGRHTLCAYLETRKAGPSAVASTLAAGSAAIVYDPDCLGSPELAAPKAAAVKGRLGAYRLTGQVFWPLTIRIDRTAPITAGPGPWSATAAIPDADVKQLEQGLQAVDGGSLVDYKQAGCRAADGSSAPAPYDTLEVSVFAPVRIGRDGSVLAPGELPPATFDEVDNLHLILTPDLAFPAGTTTGGTFTRTVRLDPPGKARAVLLGTGSQTGSGLMAVKIGFAGRRALAKLPKRVKQATLALETTFKPNGAGKGTTRRSTMKIVR